ncbi:L-threonylcarbamoyladenylate synthase [Kaustia mangrovi]|uniref:L-threonylcarbamoyladenylate synthase n=1 Tax=Kaustia mangrovi TaxID=2593653 RepID=UPI001FEB80B4|nr:L-threonylcarbamoyladenylate synthase [Kaustia mangrovi]
MTVTEEDIDRAAAALKRGELVAFPTETVYGLGADATSDTAVAAIFAAKKRPRFNPLIVHVASLEAAMALGRFDADALALARAFWPGPLSLVVPRSAGCAASLLVSAGLDTIALRVPAHPVAQALIAASGLPIAAPSANVSGRISPTTAAHVRESLGDAVAVILDGGPTSVGLESTVVACLGGPARLLRPGGAERAHIEAVLDRQIESPGGDPERPASPGQMESHYAPAAGVRLEARTVAPGEALLAFGPKVPPHDGPMRNLSPSGDLNEAAANLFRFLHELDTERVGTIAVMPIPRDGLGEAINDRLRRAAAPRPE